MISRKEYAKAKLKKDKCYSFALRLYLHITNLFINNFLFTNPQNVRFFLASVCDLAYSGWKSNFVPMGRVLWVIVLLKNAFFSSKTHAPDHFCKFCCRMVKYCSFRFIRRLILKDQHHFYKGTPKP